MHEVVGRMFDRKLLSSRPSSFVKRAKEYSLSAEGEAALRALIPVAWTSQARVLEILPPEYRKILVHCLQVIIDHNGPAFTAETGS